MKYFRSHLVSLACSVATLIVLLYWLNPQLAAAADDMPQNIDSNLRHMLQQAEGRTSRSTAVLATSPTNNIARSFNRFDTQGRILVHVYLDGSQALPLVEKSLIAGGGNVIGREPSYRNGVLALYLPLTQLRVASTMPGVQAITSEYKPKLHVGAATSEGTVVLKTNRVNTELGLRGDGITVGAISDSFDVEADPPHAADDVATGDLPVVNVLEDFVNPRDFDEGRAMLQIVYDVAPHAHLAFATAFPSEINFVNNIRRLRTEANCDIIVDDLLFPDEPVFSDGMLAQTVNEVVDSTALPGKRVVYCSCAFNHGDNGYRATYRNLEDHAVRSSHGHGNLKFVTDPNSPNYLDPALTAGGWHNWNPDPSRPAESMTTISSTRGFFFAGPGDFYYFLGMQWDDPFDLPKGVTTDYNLLVFDMDGNYLGGDGIGLSGDNNNFQTKQPLEFAGYFLRGASYQIAITRTAQTNNASPQRATHLALYSSFNADGTMRGKYFRPDTLTTPAVFGHAGAAGAIAVAAYIYDWTGKQPYKPEIEDFTSPGPTTIYFDAAGHRLGRPEIREKPDIAAVDGVATTFGPIGFFGTSAAAPHAAGVAALLIQAAGGPGSISPAEVKRVMQLTAMPRDSEPFFSQAVATEDGRDHSQSPQDSGHREDEGTVTITAQGEAFENPDFLSVKFLGSPNQSVRSLTIDVANSGLFFDLQPTESNPGYSLGTLIGLRPSDVILLNGTQSGPSLSFSFAPGAFKSGDSFSFVAGVHSIYPTGIGDSADFLASSAVRAHLTGSPAQELTGTFSKNDLVRGYQVFDGYGLIDAYAAARAVQIAHGHH